MGSLVIDTSGLLALEPDLPLVVPGVNPQVLAEYRNRNIVAIADSMVSQLLTAITPLTEQAGLSRLHVMTLMSASARGKVAVDELAGQSAHLLNGIPALLQFWAVEDNVLFGGALMTIETAERLAQEQMY